MSTVYTTDGGGRFHEDPECYVLGNGRWIAAWVVGDWGGPGDAPLYPLEESTTEDAARAGRTACRMCVPTAKALPTTGETYGHEPVIEMTYYGDEQVCARCRWNNGSVAVPWPCTSAVVLGLVVVDADRWNARYPVGTPVAAYPGARCDEPLHTTTRTPAWSLGHGTSVVSADGYAGGIALTHVDPL